MVERYLAAGLVVAGKTNTPEWGNHCTTEPVLFGPTVNPRAPDRSPGGSSGGSAAAVAAGLVPAASGGDGTGSIRVPASCCGVIGLKPARGRKTFAPDAGHVLEGLVNEHALTRTVRDCAALLDATAGPAPGDPYTAPAPAEPWLRRSSAIRPAADPLDGRRAVRRHHAPRRARRGRGRGSSLRSSATRSAGCAGLRPRAGPRRGRGPAPGLNLELYALAEPFARAPAERRELEPTAWEMLEEGRSVTGEQYARAIATVHAQGAALRHRAGGLRRAPGADATDSGPPPLAHLNQPRGSTRAFFRLEFATTGWTPMANVSGFAAISLPLADTPDGLPLGIQLMAPEETVLLQLAVQLERAGELTTAP